MSIQNPVIIGGISADTPCRPFALPLTLGGTAVSISGSVSVSGGSSGVQFVDNAASGATPTGTLEMGWDSAGSKIRALKVDTSQNLLVAWTNAQHTIIDSATLGTVTISGTVALGSGSNVIGHVITDTNSVTAATLSAETTKVIGTINVASAQTIAVTQAVAANLNATVSGTVTTTPPLNASTNITQIVGVAPSTAGKLDIKGADGDMFVRQATGSNLHVVVDTAPTTAVTNAGLTNIDVLLSSRTKPADQQHAIIDSGTTAVTQATAASLNATVVFPSAQAITLVSTTVTGNVTVVQPTGTNLHVVIDTIPTTTVTGTVTANQGGAPWQENITQFGSNPVVTGLGVSGIGIPRITVSNDSNILATQSGLWTITGNVLETSGNLATLAIQTRNDAQIVDLLQRAVARLDAINLTLAHGSNLFVDPDEILNSLPQAS